MTTDLLISVSMNSLCQRTKSKPVYGMSIRYSYLILESGQGFSSLGRATFVPFSPTLKLYKKHCRSSFPFQVERRPYSMDLKWVIQGVIWFMPEMGKGLVGRWGGNLGIFNGGGQSHFTVGGWWGVKNFFGGGSFFSFLQNFGEFFCDFYNFVTPIWNFYGDTPTVNHLNFSWWGHQFKVHDAGSPPPSPLCPSLHFKVKPILMHTSLKGILLAIFFGWVRFCYCYKFNGYKATFEEGRF